MPVDMLDDRITYRDLSSPPECIERHDYSRDPRVLALVAAIEVRARRQRGGFSGETGLRKSAAIPPSVTGSSDP